MKQVLANDEDNGKCIYKLMMLQIIWSQALKDYEIKITISELVLKTDRRVNGLNKKAQCNVTFDLVPTL